jgi:two-component system sensor histidine kinase YesM
MIGFDFAAIKAIYSDFNTYVKGQIMILTDDGTVIFDSSEEYYNKVYPYFDTIRNAAGFLELNEPSFVDVTKFGEYGVYFVSVIPQTEFTKNIASLRITMYAISILFIIIIVVLYYLSTRKFARRVNAVVDVINKVGDNNLTQRIPVKGEDDEIALISRIFNKMCDNLQDYIEKVYITEIKQKRMELKALQAQVNPHFLYNTLESIRMGMHKEGNEESADMIYHLAELFRISLKSDSVVTLKDELAYCMTYLKLFSIRYGEKLGFSFDIPDNICEYGIIKHLLQPLIENFIVHGFSWDKDMNHIAIKARADGLNIHIIISDNGSGIHEDRLEEIRLELGSFQATTSDSIGLKNVNDRIKLVFGKQYGLNVSSIHGHGTEVTLTIPQKTKDELKKIIQAS